MNTPEVEGLDWSDDRLIPAFQPIASLTICDAAGASNETLTTLATLIGLVNRPQPKVYFVLSADEAFWLEKVFTDIPKTPLPVKGENTLQALLELYAKNVKGLVIYDPLLKDSINIAIMIASQQDALAVSPGQVEAMQETHHFPVVSDLRSYHWKNRLQAYHWALQNLRNGCSSRLVAGLPVGNFTLLPFLVATRTFIYSLDSRKYLPDFASLLIDGLLSERALMRQIFATYPPGSAHLGWFVDESSGVDLTSQVAMTVLATDHFANLDVWSAVPARSKDFIQPVAEQAEPVLDPNAVYVSFTISDGDNLQYCQHRMKNLWQDAARSTLPIGWTFSPSLLHAAPRLTEYYFSTASSDDEFVAGPSGAGYMFPSHWPEKELDAFLQLTGKQMQALQMTTIEVLDTNFIESSGLPFISKIPQGMLFANMERITSFADTLKAFDVSGILSGAGMKKLETKLVDGVAYYQNIGLAASVKSTVQMIQKAEAKTNGQRPLFLNVYMLAWTITPSDVKAIVQQLGSNYRVVLPRTLLALYAKASMNK